MTSSSLVVLGGGLTGLTVAFRASQRGRRVVLVERAARLGGQIHTHVEDGVTIELGAEGFVARSERLPALCADLGLGEALIDQTTTLTYALEGGTLRALEAGEAARILGFQVPKEELGRGIRSLARGMGQLTDRLAEMIAGEVDVRTESEAVAITRDGSALHVTLASGTPLEAGQIVVATSAPRAASLLAPLAGDAVRGLGEGSLLSNASVTLRFARAQVRHALDGSGFIVPDAAALGGVRACSFVTTKFARPAPEGAVLLRVFFRPTASELERDDQAWIDLAVRSVGPVLGLSGAPLAAWASVWPRALPVYDAAYKDAVRRAEASLTPLGVRLAGSHFHGAGIDAAVASAERAAEPS